MTEALWDKADHLQVKLNEEKDLAASTRHWKKLAWQLAYARTWLGQIPCVPSFYLQQRFGKGADLLIQSFQSW